MVRAGGSGAAAGARAAASLAAGILAGSLLGIERMVAGGHFLSDIVWAALIVFGVTHAVYHLTFRRRDSRV